MVTKAGERREARERRTRILNANVTADALVCSLLVFVLRPTTLWIVVILATAFLITLYTVWTCGGFTPKWTKRIGLLIVDVALFGMVGYNSWPRITVSPNHIAFAGYPNETFSLSVKNDRSDDVYDVQIPFPIGHDKHFEDKLSAKVFSNGDPPQRLYDDYNYCFGVGKDVRKVMPHEQEVLIVRIRHLPPFGIGSFSITYAGGEKFETKSGIPNFTSEPYSYSSMQSTLGVRWGLSNLQVRRTN